MDYNQFLNFISGEYSLLASMARYATASNRRYDSDDVLQTVLINADQRAKDGFFSNMERPQVLGWFRLTIRTAARKAYTRENRKRRSQEREEGLSDWQGIVDYTLLEVDLSDLLEVLREMVLPRDMQVLELAMEGYQSKQIGQKMKLSADQVYYSKQKLKRALAALAA